MSIQRFTIARRNSPKQKLPTGAVRFEPPKIVEERWTTWANQVLAHGDRKQLLTAMLCLAMGMPRELRSQLTEWGRAAERNPHIAGNVEGLMEGFVERVRLVILNRRGVEEPAEPLSAEATHFVDRILDPRLFTGRPHAPNSESRMSA